jgi:hypothetical protein
MKALKEKIASAGFLPAMAVICAALLRLWAINFGLPHTETRPDESTVIIIAFQLISAKLHPVTLIYPTLFTYILAAIFSVFALFKGAGGHIYDFLTSYYIASPSFFFITARLLGAACGIANVIPCYLMGRELKNEKAAICSAFFMAFCYLNVRDSHFGVLDVPMTLFITWAAFFALRALRTGALRDYVLCGVFTGLATGTKYAGIIMIAQMFCVHALSLRAENKITAKTLFTDRRISLFCVSLLGVFFLTTPYLFLDINTTMEGYKYHNQLHNFMGGSNWLHHLEFSLLEGLGAPMFIAAAAGIIILAIKDIRKLTAGFLFAVLYFIVISRTGSGYVRYAVPLLPFACVAAGYLTAVAAGHRNAGRLWLVIPVVIIGQSAARCADFDLLLSQTDTRVLAARYMEDIAGPYTIFQSASPYTDLQLRFDTDYYAYREQEALSRNALVRARLYEVKKETAQSATGAPKPLYYNPDGSFSDVSGAPAGPPDYIAVMQEPFNFGIADNFARLLDEKYEKQAFFEGFDETRSGNTYDTEDAFFVPFSGFYGITRPGPNVYVFKRK